MNRHHGRAKAATGTEKMPRTKSGRRRTTRSERTFSVNVLSRSHVRRDSAYNRLGRRRQIAQAYRRIKTEQIHNANGQKNTNLAAAAAHNLFTLHYTFSNVFCSSSSSFIRLLYSYIILLFCICAVRAALRLLAFSHFFRSFFFLSPAGFASCCFLCESILSNLEPARIAE